MVSCSSLLSLIVCSRDDNMSLEETCSSLLETNSWSTRNDLSTRHEVLSQQETVSSRDDKTMVCCWCHFGLMVSCWCHFGRWSLVETTRHDPQETINQSDINNDQQETVSCWDKTWSLVERSFPDDQEFLGVLLRDLSTRHDLQETVSC